MISPAAHDYLTWHMLSSLSQWIIPGQSVGSLYSLYLARHNLTAFHREEQNLSLFGIWNEIYRIY